MDRGIGSTRAETWVTPRRHDGDTQGGHHHAAPGAIGYCPVVVSLWPLQRATKCRFGCCSAPKTGYKWLKRATEVGEMALVNRSRRHRHLGDIRFWPPPGCSRSARSRSVRRLVVAGKWLVLTGTMAGTRQATLSSLSSNDDNRPLSPCYVLS